MALFLAALLLVADPSAASQADPIEAPKVEKEKKICKVDPNFTGTRMRKRICMTETEWANKNATTVNDLKNMGAR